MERFEKLLETLNRRLSRRVRAAICVGLVVLGLSIGGYTGPVQNYRDSVGWTQYPAEVTAQGMQLRFFADHGGHPYWYLTTPLPLSWQKGHRFQVWVKWDPDRLLLNYPAAFHVSSFVDPLVGFLAAWIAAFGLTWLMNPRKRRRRRAEH